MPEWQDVLLAVLGTMLFLLVVVAVTAATMGMFRPPTLRRARRVFRGGGPSHRDR